MFPSLLLSPFTHRPRFPYLSSPRLYIHLCHRRCSSTSYPCPSIPPNIYIHPHPPFISSAKAHFTPPLLENFSSLSPISTPTHQSSILLTDRTIFPYRILIILSPSPLVTYTPSHPILSPSPFKYSYPIHLLTFYAPPLHITLTPPLIILYRFPIATNDFLLRIWNSNKKSIFPEVCSSLVCPTVVTLCGEYWTLGS